jgi:hypothetical protein
MYKHPVSALVRLFPSIAWVGVCVMCLWMPVGLYLQLFTPGRWNDPGKAVPEALLLLGFIAVAVYGARMARKEYKEALPALRADTPIRIGLPITRRTQRAYTPTTYLLKEELRIELRRIIESLQAAEVLQPGEAPLEDVIACAETVDDYSEMDLYNVMHVLQALHLQRKRPFANLAFLEAQVETDEADAIAIIREFARLSGQTQRLDAIRVQAIDGGKIAPARGGEFPPPNAVAEFTLGTQHYSVPFVLYGKNLPGGLMEELAKICIRDGDARRFVWENFDGFFSISYLTTANTAALNNALPNDFPVFETIR